jgi:hypothetical protein
MSNPISLAEIQSIISNFGPILRFHPDEKYLLDDPDRLLGTGKCSLESGLVTGEEDYGSYNLEVLSSTKVTSDTLMKEVSKTRELAQAGDPKFRYWLRIDDSLKPGNMPLARAQVCVVAGATADDVDLQFWFFYGFNGPGKVLVDLLGGTVTDKELETAGNHYGDWEHVTIRMHRDAGAWKLHAVYLSRHALTIWITELSLLQFTGTHPVVYVGRDSHAHYEGKGKHIYETQSPAPKLEVELYDITADGGQTFDSSVSKQYVIVSSDFPAHAITRPSWTAFERRWGQYEKQEETVALVYTYKEVASGPVGPLQHGNVADPITLHLPNTITIVGTAGNVGIWNPQKPALITNLDKIVDWTVLMVAQDRSNPAKLYCVGTDNNVGLWNGSAWHDLGKMGGWSLKMIAFDAQNNMWCVNTDDMVGEWNGTAWDARKDMSNWQLKMIAFDAQDQRWCVGGNGNVGRWTTTQWTDQKKPWSLKMIAFDAQSQLWCIGTDGNVGKWNDSKNAWDDYQRPGSWAAQWLAFLR